jgi:hypothetical protein
MADAIDLLDTNDIATASTVTPASAGRRRSSLHHGAPSVNKAKKPSKKGKSGGHKKCAPLLKDLDVAADTPIIRQPSSSFDKQDGETTDPMAENTEILKGK